MDRRLRGDDGGMRGFAPQPCYRLLLAVILVALRASLRMLLRRAAAGAAATLLAAAALALAAAVVLVALRAGTARFFGVELVGVARSVCRLAAFGCDLALLLRIHRCETT